MTAAILFVLGVGVGGACVACFSRMTITALHRHYATLLDRAVRVREGQPVTPPAPAQELRPDTPEARVERAFAAESVKAVADAFLQEAKQQGVQMSRVEAEQAARLALAGEAL